MRRIALALLASTSLLGLASVAEAADLMVRKVVAQPPPPPIYSWTGFYIGAHIGAGWSRKDFHTPDPFCNEFTAYDESQDGFTLSGCENNRRGSHNAIGGLGGFQAGYNWQAGVVVFGIEGQYSWANLKGDHSDSFHFAFVDPFEEGNSFLNNRTSRFSSDVKGIGTIAGRIGLTSVLTDRTLFYVKGGAAYVKEDFTETITGASVDCAEACVSTLYSADASASRHRWGWMVGVGLEFGLWDNWSGKVEYNYLDFGKDDPIKLTGTECFTDIIGKSCTSFDREHKVDQNIQLIKFGLNYRFGIGKAPPITARY